MLARNAADKFFRTLDNLEYGQLELTTPDGKVRNFAGQKPGPSSRIVLNDWSVLGNLALKGDTGFAEAYKSGNWDTDNLKNLLILALKNDTVISPYLFGSKLMQVVSKLSYYLRLNTISGSRRNIHAHYDLGNRFYELWLDPGMTYSAAIFKDKQDNLDAAQLNKYDRIIDRLSHRSGRLLEIGCGWGAFAERALQRGDYAVQGLTISTEQHTYAQQRLGGQADIRLEDYRLQQGKFQNIVSIEMFEAVGERYWRTYFSKLKDLLHHDGRAVIQTITIDEKHFDKYRKSGDVIRDYIFPGGMLPSPSRFCDEARAADFKVNDVYKFGEDYALTLEHWLARFEKAQDEVLALGFDHEFIRLWKFYLAACIAGFRTGRTDVMQVELQHA